jgi:hypothetical protein
VSGCLGLPAFSQEQIPLVAVWHLLGLGTQALGLFSEAVGKDRMCLKRRRCIVLLQWLAGAQLAFSSPMTAGDQAVMRWNVRLGLGKIHVVY